MWGILQANQALDQQQATILQTYIDNIQDLLLNHNLLGDSPKPKNDADKVTIQEVQELARARTLTALEGLDPDRKVRLVQFLFEAHLIGFLDTKLKQQGPIIDLVGADLTGVNFNNANLIGVNLSCANPNAEFTFVLQQACVILKGANFTLAALEYADFSYDSLQGANLSYAQLGFADLTGADLAGAALYNVGNLTQYQLDLVSSCKYATLPQGLTCHHNQ